MNDNIDNAEIEETEVNYRELSESDRARLRGSKDYSNITMYPDGELDVLSEFMSAMPEEMFEVLVEIVTDIANTRANETREVLVDKIAESVADALELDDEDERFTSVEDAVYETVNDTFLERFGDF